MNGRDYTKLIYLTPGVAGSPDQISDSPGSYGTFSMNGARGRANNFLLDGTDMNDGYRNDPAINEAGVFGTPATILPIDAVSELKVLSNFEAEYGRNAGAVINIVTKSGQNRIHGDSFDYFRNNALDARNYLNPSGTPQAPFHNNQYGAAHGRTDHKGQDIFLRGLRRATGARGRGQRGRRAGSFVAGGNESGDSDLLEAYPNNDPWPLPNLGGGRGGEASAVTPSYNKLTSLIAKVDHNINQNNILTGRYFFGDSVQSFPLALTGGGVLPGFNTYTPTRVQLVSISYVSVLSPTKVNEARFGWNRFAEGFFPDDQSFEPSSVGLCAATTVPDCTGADAIQFRLAGDRRGELRPARGESFNTAASLRYELAGTGQLLMEDRKARCEVRVRVQADEHPAVLRRKLPRRAGFRHVGRFSERHGG